MSHQLAYLNITPDNVYERECDSLVTPDNVCLGRRVQWGKHWSKKWRDNMMNGVRIYGTIIGYVDETGLVGINSRRKYNQVQQGQQDWCVVEWDNGKQSVYPIGAQGFYALAWVH